MAGRKPRHTRDEQAGVIPLRGVPVAGTPAAGSRVRRKENPQQCTAPPHEIRPGVQAAQTQLPPFPYGNKVNETHGMSEEQIVARELVEPYLRAVLDDPNMPDHLRSPQFAGALEAWARVQYLADRAYAKVAVRPFEEIAEPLGRSGQGKSLVELWLRLESMAAKLRGELGMTPASYARLRASLGLAHQAEADALRKMALTGSEITSRRAAIEAPKPPLAGQLVPDGGAVGEFGGEMQAAVIGADLARQHAPHRVIDEQREPVTRLYRPSLEQLMAGRHPQRDH